MTEYAPGEVKYKLATLRSEVGEMALTYIHELDQKRKETNSILQVKCEQS